MEFRYLRSELGSSYEDYGCQLNAITIDQLFDAYSKAGFLYPKKLRYIENHLSKVKNNWNRAINSPRSLLRVVTFGNSHSKSWASISGWQSTDSCWHMQHLVSTGNPLASCAVLLAESAMRINSSRIKSAQYWFRPENRYAKNVLGTIGGTVPGGTFKLLRNKIFMIKRPVISSLLSGSAIDKNFAKEEILQFASAHKGDIYVKAAALDREDGEMSEIDNMYRESGLRRYRRIIVSRDEISGTINGIALVYRGPLGLNFSFLENRSEILLSVDHAGSSRRVLCSLLKAIVQHYDDFELDVIPVTIDVNRSELMQSLGFMPFQQYDRIICLQSGYFYWYKHIQSIFAPVVDRASRKNVF